MNEQGNQPGGKRRFYAGAFFSPFLLNFAIFIVSIFLILNRSVGPLVIVIFLFLLNVFSNIIAYKAFKNRDMYLSFLYGQIAGFSLSGLLITICGGLFRIY